MIHTVRGWRVSLWLTVDVLSVAGVGSGLGALAVQTWMFWLLLTGFHVLFCLDAAQVSRFPDAPAATRRVWRGMCCGVMVFLVGDVIQLAALLDQPITPALAQGTRAQGVLVLVGTGIGLVTLLVEPLRLGSVAARWRFWLDVAVVMAGVAAIGAHTLQLPSTAAAADVAYWLGNGPVIFAVGAFAVLKLVLAPNRPFDRTVGRILGAAALVQGLAGGIADVLVRQGHLPWLQAIVLLGNVMLALSARLQRVAVQAPDPARGQGPSRRFSLLPYAAVSATNAVLLFTLATEGLTRRAWLVIVATVAGTGFVAARQLLALTETSHLLHALDVRVTELDQALAERDVLAAELEHLAYHDPLTQLANRALFNHRLQQTLDNTYTVTTGPTHEPLVVLLIDLDGFKQVNDLYGHACGDALLVAVAQRIRACTRPGDLIARLGGDEFSILLHAEPHQATAIAERIVQSIARPFDVATARVQIGASVGLAVAAPRHQDSHDLLHRADSAMYQAKRNGKNRYLLDANTRG